MNDPPNRQGPYPVTRRSLLAGAMAFAVGGIAGRSSASSDQSSPVDQTEPFYGTHQAGITTPPQSRAVLAAYDLATDKRTDVIELLERWSEATARLTTGQPVQQERSGFATTTGDTGEALGLGPARLTLTFGFGPGLFEDKTRGDRYGLASRRPAPLIDIPAFRNDELEAAYSSGDLVVQACADDPQVAVHAVRNLTELARGAAVPRWLQLGFGRASSRPTKDAPRNLIGFHDGTNNLDSTDDAKMDSNVWAGEESPPWMRGGSYMVVRRVRIRIEHWDANGVAEQEATIGRDKMTGAPLGGHGVRDSVDPAKLPHDAHIIRANPRTPGSEAERILRRGYSFVDGIDDSFRELEAGLLFICFQRDPRRQFLKIQERLTTNDHLSEYTFHTGSAIFAMPPGFDREGYVGQSLF